jgi:hypothetical protein
MVVVDEKKEGHFRCAAGIEVKSGGFCGRARRDVDAFESGVSAIAMAHEHDLLDTRKNPKNKRFQPRAPLDRSPRA